MGEVSGAAEAFGVSAGMPLGEALARCPQLGLIAADPLAVAQAWEEIVCALEGIGAAVESAREGLAYFELDGLRGLVWLGHPHDRGHAPRARSTRADRGRSDALRCDGRRARQRELARAKILQAEFALRYLAAQPVSVLGFREDTESLVEPLERLGVRTLG